MKTTTSEEWWKLTVEERRSFTGIVISYNMIEHIKNGGYHNFDGPALKWGKIVEYYINNVRLLKSEWKKHPEVIKKSTEFKDLIKYKESI